MKLTLLLMHVKKKEMKYNMKTICMKNPNTLDEVDYNIYDSHIEAVTDDNSISRFDKGNRCDNQVIMDLINNGIRQGCVISSLQVIDKI